MDLSDDIPASGGHGFDSCAWQTKLADPEYAKNTTPWPSSNVLDKNIQDSTLKHMTEACRGSRCAASAVSFLATLQTRQTPGGLLPSALKLKWNQYSSI